MRGNRMGSVASGDVGLWCAPPLLLSGEGNDVANKSAKPRQAEIEEEQEQEQEHMKGHKDPRRLKLG
jgi:hypothetical protein